MANAGTRLVRVLQKVREVSNLAPAVDHWARILGVASFRGAIDDDLVIRRLSIVRLQAASLRSLLGPKAEAESFASHLSRLDQLLSIRLFGQPWEQTRSLLTEETFQVLQATASLLPDEPATDSSELDRVRSEVKSIADSLTTDSGLPDELLRFLRATLQDLEETIKDFELGGADVIKLGVDAAAHNWFKNQDVVMSFKDAEVVKRAWSLWRSLDVLTSTRTYRIASLAMLVFADAPQAMKNLETLGTMLQRSVTTQEDYPSPDQGQFPLRSPALLAITSDEADCEIEDDPDETEQVGE